VLFVILLAWIEHRRQRRQGFTDSPPSPDREAGAEPNLPPMFREPTLSLPEMRARDPGPPQELPVVEIDDDSLSPRRLEPDESRGEPPILSLPVLDSGPVAQRPRSAEPEVSSFDDALTRTDAPSERKVPRLDTPAPRSAAGRIDPDTAERTFNEAVFGGAADPEPDFSDAEAIEEGAIADAAGTEGMSAGRRSGRWADDASANAADSADPDAINRADADTDLYDADRADVGANPAAGDITGSEAAASASSADARFTPADVTPITEPIVEWPPDDQRRVVALRLVAPPPERLAGRAVRLALASEGFVIGKFQIFHKPDESGRAVLSAANLSKPGTFDLDNMDSQRYGGLSLFTVLPGPRPPLKAFEDLLATARSLNERLQGALQDERGGPLTPTRIATLRESLSAETTP
jgi:hypothetical protein